MYQLLLVFGETRFRPLDSLAFISCIGHVKMLKAMILHQRQPQEHTGGSVSTESFMH